MYDEPVSKNRELLPEVHIGLDPNLQCLISNEDGERDENSLLQSALGIEGRVPMIAGSSPRYSRLRVERYAVVPWK